MSNDVPVVEMAGCVVLPHFASYGQVLSRSVLSRVVSTQGSVDKCYYGLVSSLAGYR